MKIWTLWSNPLRPLLHSRISPLTFLSKRIQRYFSHWRNRQEKITDNGLDDVTKIFEKLALESISLKFIWCEGMTDNGLKILRQNLQKLTSLKSLSLNFSLYNRVIKIHISHSYNRCLQITDEGLDNLTQDLQQFTNLEEISIDFSSSNEITDVGLDNLRKGLQTIPSLKSLSLNFNKWKFPDFLI